MFILKSKTKKCWHLCISDKTKVKNKCNALNKELQKIALACQLLGESSQQQVSCLAKTVN
jgi:hypothetical protein